MPVLLVAAALIGLAVGSFLNVVIHRVPAGFSIVRPASACPVCRSVIRTRHNVPVVGWMVLRGRCFDCAAPISVRYPLVELLTAAVFVLLTWHAAAADKLAVLPAVLVFAASGIALSAIDLDVMRLPNAIVYPTLATVLGALAIASVITGDLQPFVRAVVAALALGGFFLAIVLAKPGGMGLGDVKLALVVGAVLGYASYPAVVVGAFAAFVLGSVAGALLIAAGGAGRRSMIPFGPALIVGALFSLIVGGQVADAYLRLLQTV